MKIDDTTFQSSGRIVLCQKSDNRTLIGGLLLDQLLPKKVEGWQLWNVAVTLTVTKKWEMTEHSDLFGGRIDQIVRTINDDFHWKEL